MLKKTVAGAALIAAALALPGAPALASVAPSTMAIHAQANSSAVQPVYYRHYGYGWRGGWRRPYAFRGYYRGGYPGYYGWGYPAGYGYGYGWGYPGYGWGPGVSFGFGPGFGFGFGF